MASTKTPFILDDDVTLVAGAGDHTSAEQPLPTGYGAGLYIKFTNGATPPTVAPQAQIYTSPVLSGNYWYKSGGPLLGGLAANGVTPWGNLPIPITAQRVKVVSGSNTNQNVVIRVEGVEVTATS